MAKAKGNSSGRVIKATKKVTSIGNSHRSRPKHKKANKKKYRGQGKP